VESSPDLGWAAILNSSALPASGAGYDFSGADSLLIDLSDLGIKEQDSATEILEEPVATEPSSSKAEADNSSAAAPQSASAQASAPESAPPIHDAGKEDGTAAQEMV